MKFHRYALGVGLIAMTMSVGAQTGGTKTYIVELADAPAATYSGQIRGLAATRPMRGAKLDANSPNVRAYRSFLSIRQDQALAKIGNIPTLHRYSVAFNGFSARLTEAQAKALASSAGVRSITESEIHRLDTTRTPGFLGINAPGGLWSQLDASGSVVKGENVIIGVIDSGIWPENPSFSDKVDALGTPVAYNQVGTQVYGPPPAKWKGVCQTGAGFTAAMCNNKLIGARYYVNAFKSNNSLTTLEYESPRDGDGHGSHTASTAGGNANVQASINGTSIGAITGIAPRARVAAYKVCWGSAISGRDACYSADMVKAIDDAVSDGVDVLNHSISGTLNNFVDPVEIAYLNATTAGVFVAASAGNSGPGNAVAHISPWIMTVAASTHDRQSFADVNLGNGAAYTGASTFASILPSAPMVLSSSIPAPGVSVNNANLCLLNSLDTGAAVGKIVVCDRGTNFLVEKSAEVKRVGGIGMVLINPVTSDLVAVFHSVPTVHLQYSVRAAVRDYAALVGAVGSIRPTLNPTPVVAPVMADFSSRGPNQANNNILKPDITGPGVEVLAAYIDESLTQAQHDGVALGTFIPGPGANSLQGTSMSSPHVAGAAALLKQLYPTWSPAAIKSALMTSATDVKLATGALDANRWGYGAGHMNPNGAANPGLVYDISPADYGRFLCGLSLAPPAGLGPCSTVGTIEPWNLNLASLTASAAPYTFTFNRSVTNTTLASSTYVSNASVPGWNVVVSPASLTIAPGATANFSVTVTAVSATTGAWSFGNLTWTDGVRTVRSPLSMRRAPFTAPAEVSDTRASGKGTKVYSINSNYTGTLSVAATGLVPATLSAGAVTFNAVQCFNFTVPSGAQLARFQLFNADTLGGASTDLDLTVYRGANGTGAVVGYAGHSGSDEMVTLLNPAGGTYSACVLGYDTPAGNTSFTLSSWVVGPAVGIQTLRASAPTTVYGNTATSVGLGWSVIAGSRYLGNVQYRNGTGAVIGSTMVFVDNH